MSEINLPLSLLFFTQTICFEKINVGRTVFNLFDICFDFCVDILTIRILYHGLSSKWAWLQLAFVKYLRFKCVKLD